ncbi:MAG: bifunctional nuclease family protein [Galactobacter sp.]|uniref:bifunctional nuclease family protein n=1 Tax=Galactobacter sp. TaxID=2676125 RepID=UPI0025BA2B81|nr:bifunctional nuclease domain-containing protein [Galactobacter sp.]
MAGFEEGYVELTVVGVRVELPSNQPLVLLEEPGTQRRIPVWIGAPEASVIAGYAQGLDTPRPLTHDLLLALVAALGSHVERVRIVSVQDTVFHARVDLPGGKTVDARASDAVAVALAAGVPVLCATEVVEAVGFIADPETVTEEDEERVAEFRAFLDDIDPSDFE